MNDIYTPITDRIIAELEAGTVPWIRPWSGGGDPFPPNALSQRPYRGINTILLGMEAQCHGYASNQRLTFRQAREHGAHVRKGERGTTVVYYGQQTRTSVGDEGAEEQESFRFLKGYTVIRPAQDTGHWI